MEKKSILKTFIILIIGIVIGVLAGGMFTMHQIHRANNMRSEHGFVNEVSRLLDLSQAQLDSISPIIKDFARLNHLRHDSLRIQEKRAYDNLRTNLEPYLSEQELKKLRRLFRPKGPKGLKRKNNKKHQPRK